VDAGVSVPRFIAGALLLAGAATAVADQQPAGSPSPEAAAMIAELELREGSGPVREHDGWRKPRRILVRAELAPRLPDFREIAPEVEFIAVRDEAQAAGAIAGADAILGFCNPDIVAAGKDLRWIQLFSAGARPCADIPALRERDILLTNMQRISGPEIAEHALAMLLALTRGLRNWLPEQHKGQWDNAAFPMRTMLIVGLGGIGTALATRAHGLGMRVVATRASSAGKPAYVDYVGSPGELLGLAGEADVVVNCTPLLPSTLGLFDAKFFAAMKPGGYFINVGRGKSVVQDDLVAALKSGQLSGAGLDVTDPEPLPADHPLWRMPDVIITPHVAATSDRVFTRVFLLARENVRRYVRGERLLSVVDPSRGY
jgi:phosphoglycerate dehydrogenase-like enzyme